MSLANHRGGRSGIPRRPFELRLPRPASLVLERLRDAGHEAYAVGGAVRDALLDRPFAEVDVATSATPEEIDVLFSRTHAVGRAFGVVLVVEAATPVEVATFREDLAYRDGRHPEGVRYTDLASDARRRDFTVNALYYDPQRKEVLDPTGGLDDLRSGTLRTVGEAQRRFEEDRLRLLRCVRLANELDFEVEAQTWSALTASAAKVRSVSAERVRDELEKLLTGPHPGRGLRMLLYSGLLSALLPEVEAMVGVQQPPEHHPEGDVFVHTCAALEHLRSREAPLAWGALLHDVGKPPTFRVAERIRFDGHVAVGMEMARDVLTRLRVDRSTLERVVELVHLHLKFADVRRMRAATLKRFLRLPHFEDHLELHRADCLASHGDLSHHEFCRQKLSELAAEDLRPPPLLSGRELIALGYPPGPLFGEILDAVEEEQLEGRLSTRDEALAYVGRHWPLAGGGSA